MEKQNLKNTEVNLIYGVDDDLDLPKKFSLDFNIYLLLLVEL